MLVIPGKFTIFRRNGNTFFTGNPGNGKFDALISTSITLEMLPHHLNPLHCTSQIVPRRAFLIDGLLAVCNAYEYSFICVCVCVCVGSLLIDVNEFWRAHGFTRKTSRAKVRSNHINRVVNARALNRQRECLY